MQSGPVRNGQIEVRWVNRGGGCLVHCPGQLAVYPIVPLRWHRSEKGTGPICAKHPPGRSGKLDLSPFPNLRRRLPRPLSGRHRRNARRVERSEPHTDGDGGGFRRKMSRQWKVATENLLRPLPARVGRLYNSRPLPNHFHVPFPRAWGVWRPSPCSRRRKRPLPAPWGVWGRTGQLAALGVAVRHWITYFGAYVNVCPPMGLFRLVESDPVGHTQMSSLVAERCGPVRMTGVRAALVRRLADCFGCDRYHLYTGHPLLRATQPPHVQSDSRNYERTR